MKTKVAIDVSGLSWRYRTGVQNLFWAYVNAWIENPDLKEKFDLCFYDRSGSFNLQLFEHLGSSYQSSCPSWLPANLQRYVGSLIRRNLWPEPHLRDSINHVWNWNIYDNHKSLSSITIPDLLPLEYPDWFDSNFISTTKKSLDFARTRADFVFTISEYVRKQLIEQIGLPSEKIKVVYPGIDSNYFNDSQNFRSKDILKKYNLSSERYLISSGFIDPRKNLSRQIKAFLLATENHHTDVKYALTGLATSLSSEVLSLIDSPELRSRVVLLGYVSQPDLIALMSNSAAMMYCSIAEGFGLPIIEAMAAGSLVITSATTSMMELANRRGYTVDPFNIDEMVSCISEVLEMSTADRMLQIASNREYARRFTISNWLTGHLYEYVK